MRETKCDRYCECHGLCGYGNGGDRAGSPPDQVMDAMKEVGDKMDASLRETALGGLARTEEGVKIAEKMHASQENW